MGWQGDYHSPRETLGLEDEAFLLGPGLLHGAMLIFGACTMVYLQKLGGGFKYFFNFIFTPTWG